MIYLRCLLIFGVVLITKASLEPEVLNKPPNSSIISETIVKPTLIVEPAAIKPLVIKGKASVKSSIIVNPVVQPPDKDVQESNSSLASPTPKEIHTVHKLVKNLNISDIDDHGWNFENRTPIDTRRILFGTRSKPGKRPYMVYLQLTPKSAKVAKYRGWMCGGVVVHKNYVLTSAACVEDADRFYVVSGTTKYVDSADYKNDDCVCKHRRKVVWKCIPKNYKFDFQDSQKWSANDIAIVKVNKPFCFDDIEKGCEFAVKKIGYNNVSRDLEKPGTKGWIAGWGSNGGFREGVYRRTEDAEEGDGTKAPKNAKCLQEAKVCIMDNGRCAKKWPKKFKDIIKEYMICTKDIVKQLSEVCDKKYANCTFVDNNRRHQESAVMESPPKNYLSLDLGRHLRDPEDYSSRRFNSAGFCENDHGGPLIVKYANKDRVIGVISACKIDPKTNSCHGPFLYTSVFVNRQFISCAIFKDIEGCKRVFRAGVTHEEWPVNWGGEEDDKGRTTKIESNKDGDDKGDIEDKEDEEEKEDREDNDDDDPKNTKEKNREDDDDDDTDNKDDGSHADDAETSVESVAMRSKPKASQLRLRSDDSVNASRQASAAPKTADSIPEPNIKTGKFEPLKA